MTLKELLPKKKTCRKHIEWYVPCEECSECHIINKTIDDCETALSGKVMMVESVLGVEEIEKIIELYNSDNPPIDGTKHTWNEFKKHFATAIHSEQMRKLNNNKGE